jgi:hypothetical protein
LCPNEVKIKIKIMKKIITLLSTFLLLFVVAKAQVYFDDVESYEPFTINPTTGPWTFVDVDSCNTYRIGGYLWDNVLEPQAFIVFNPSLTDPEFTNSTGTPYSGAQYFAAYRSFRRLPDNTTEDCPNNNWLISPELSGQRAVSISFWARAFQGEPEKFRIAYSTSGNDVQDFTFLPSTLPCVEIGENEREWTYYTYQTPAAKYVALNNVSDDGFFFMLDDIEVREIFDVDLAVFGLGVPDYSCELTTEETIEIGITNYGNTAVTAFKACYQIGNNPVVEENVTGVNIPKDSSVIYTFATLADLTFAMDADSIRGWVVLVGDEFNMNDTTAWYKTGTPAPAIPPYYNDFSGDDDYKGWSVVDVNEDESTWQIVHYVGNPMWYYEYNENNNANDWLFSSCFDLQPGSYTVEFRYASYTYYTPESFGLYFGTKPAPTDMTLVKNFNNIINTDFLQGSEVINITTAGIYYLGFKATSSADQYHLFLDNINLVPARNNDLAVYKVNVPDYSCDLTNAEQVSVEVKNCGLNAVTSFKAYYQIGNQTAVMEDVTVEILPQASYTYNFNTLADLTIPAMDSILVWVELLGDENNTNDTAETWILTGTIAPVDSFPYSNKFTTDEDNINWTVDDIDLDGTTWHPISYNSNPMWYHNGVTIGGGPEANDWLYSTCFDLEEGDYTLKFKYCVYRQYAANLSVHFGQAKDPAQMEEIENLTLFDNADFAQLERVITVTTPGTYYFGFYAYGMVQYFMFIDDFELHKGDVSGINENANLVDNFVTIYPNPAKDKITLQSSEEMAQVKIYDMFGKTIGTYQVSGLETTIGVDKLASGIYIAEITTINNSKAVKKFSITQ